LHTPDYYGSFVLSSTMKVGLNLRGENVYKPIKDVINVVNPIDLCVTGWDIYGVNLYNAIKECKVLDYDLQEKLKQ